MILTLTACWLHRVALSLWLGGLIAIGALVAPTAFHVLSHTPALAGDIVGGSLRIFNVLCLVCGLVMLFADACLWRWFTRPTTACILLTVLLLALTGYLGWILFPALDAAQSAHQTILFTQYHVRYERLSGWELPLLLALAGFDTARSGRIPFSN